MMLKRALDYYVITSKHGEERSISMKQKSVRTRKNPKTAQKVQKIKKRLLELVESLNAQQYKIQEGHQSLNDEGETAAFVEKLSEKSSSLA